MRLRELFGRKRTRADERPSLAESSEYRAADATEPVVGDGSTMSGPGGSAPGPPTPDDPLSPASQIGRADQTEHGHRTHADLPVERSDDP